ncbi:S26 family signal peptidase [Sphingosinicella sp. CPCC 101087]|uniref:S26 family signal peptidase n=1 Tax=Sphingosinicella sp. CPCC 101087 TaxID=2497754 RepID=UPI00101BF4D6|nr:S26 family signal peptidase [Sphingosinicella sp. CPCC 101087]
MPEHRALPLFRWGEELRRHRRVRRMTRLRMLAAAAGAAAATASLGTIVWPPGTLLLWNASASSPLGLYVIGPTAGVAAGDMVAAWPPDAARRLGAERHYLPANVPLVKRVAATAGDRVCAAGEAVFVNGRLETMRPAHDRSGRPMPWWTGCATIPEGGLFLLAPSVAEAFDGRYFGITRREHVLGRATLIWPD